MSYRSWVGQSEPSRIDLRESGRDPGRSRVTDWQFFFGFQFIYTTKGSFSTSGLLSAPCLLFEEFSSKWKKRVGLPFHSLTVDSANAFEGEAPDSSVALFFHLKATLLSQWRVLSRSLRNSDLVFALWIMENSPLGRPIKEWKVIYVRGLSRKDLFQTLWEKEGWFWGEWWPLLVW